MERGLERLPSEFLGNVIRVSLSQMIVHWQECPSYRQSEYRLHAQLLETGASARCAAFDRFFGFTLRSRYCKMESAVLSEKSVQPLFQKVPASVIQMTVAAMQKMFTSQKEFAASVVDFFGSSKEYRDLFAMITFPAVFSYFLTDELAGLAGSFVEEIVKIDRSVFAKAVLAAYFDGYPRFIDTLWSTFDRLCVKESVLSALRGALAVASGQLSRHHAKLIDLILELDRDFMVSFFFGYYLEPRAHMRYFSTSNNAKLVQLISLLKMAAESGAPHGEILLQGLDRRSMSVHHLTYHDDIGLPTMYVILSELELFMLRTFLAAKGYLKTNRFTVDVNDEQVLAPGYVQFSVKRILGERKEVEQMPILFAPKETHETVNPVFARAWKKLKQLAEEEGISPDQMIKKPKTARCKDAVSLPLTQSVDFRNYLCEKMLNKAESSQQRFERFVRLLCILEQLEKIKGDWCLARKYYMWKRAEEFIINSCMIQCKPTLQKTVGSDNSTKTDFFQQRYKRSLPVTKSKPVSETATCETRPRSRCFEDLLAASADNAGNEEQVAYILFGLLNEWIECSPEKDTVALAYKGFAERQRFGAVRDSTISQVVEQWKCFRDIIVRLKQMATTKMGRQLIEFASVIDDFYGIYPQLNTNISSEDIICQCIFGCGYHGLIFVMVWFRRLIPSYSRYLELLLSPPTVTRIASVVNRTFELIGLSDSQLFDSISALSSQLPEYSIQS